MGLATNHPQQNKIAAYISFIHPTKTMWTAAQVGWFDGDNFVLPDTTIGKDSEGVLFQTESNNHPEYSTAGTLNEWRSSVAALCNDGLLTLDEIGDSDPKDTRIPCICQVMAYASNGLTCSAMPKLLRRGELPYYPTVKKPLRHTSTERLNR